MQNKIDLTIFRHGTGFLPSVSVDCVIFGFHDSQLKVLLLQPKGNHNKMLPGGFVQLSESLNEAAQRVLQERAGVKDIYLEQFYTFGAPNRTDDTIHKRYFKTIPIDLDENDWILKRFVSIGYYALTDFTKVKPTPDVLSDSCDWYDVYQLSELAFDHQEMVERALKTLRSKLDSDLVGFNLLPEVFTMQDLQNLYETILNESLLRTNFQRKILNLNILERLEKKMTGAANKAPYLYKFKK